jgi:hypothetical protein
MYRIGPGIELTIDPAVTGLTYNVVKLGNGWETTVQARNCRTV